MTETDIERQRCLDIVQAARAAEIDQDWRTVIYWIESGMSIEQIKDMDE